MQLSHAGRQSANFLGGRRAFVSPMSPSPVRVVGPEKDGFLSRAFHRLLFQTPTEMSIGDIDTVAADFVRGANVACQAGFDGVQLHLAHGCMISTS